MSFLKRAFTLLELLIVIIIIAVLMVSVLPKLSDIQVRARDMKRQKDVKNIANAIELYHHDYGRFPLRELS